MYKTMILPENLQQDCRAHWIAFVSCRYWSACFEPRLSVGFETWLSQDSKEKNELQKPWRWKPMGFRHVHPTGTVALGTCLGSPPSRTFHTVFSHSVVWVFFYIDAFSCPSIETHHIRKKLFLSLSWKRCNQSG